MERVGFVGLGAIGSPMAQRLIVSGFEVAVFDIVPERSRKLVELGAVEAHDPEEAALYGDVTVVMVATGDQALEAIFGDRGSPWASRRTRYWFLPAPLVRRRWGR